MIHSLCIQHIVSEMMRRVALMCATAATCCRGAASPLSVPTGAALSAARALIPPTARTRVDGELEGAAFWDEHDELLTKAWTELGPRLGALYKYNADYERRYIHEEFRKAVAEARAGRGEQACRELFFEALPGVFASRKIFTPQFLQDMLQELDHVEESGIPTRRPNGMNRYGVILDHVGMEAAITGLIYAYVRPVAAMLFPELVGEEDADEHYAFTVRYESGGDTELAKHGDASVVTMNLCLGQGGWEGGNLRFFEYEGTGLYELPVNVSAGAGDLTFESGMVVFHRGQHKHQALPLVSGVRTNAIVWLMGRNDVVRVAPYKPSEYLSESQRWHWPARSAAQGFHSHYEL
mmetsp:Transcript_11317/g.26042  ORF Transcript_11317/g.26042 Transcript_11317/m.26042 type:complete len:351 (-) Transcript_11317:189-1241(-)